MREFDTLRAYIPPVVIVPGTTTTDGVLGDKAIGQTYDIVRDGWELIFDDAGLFPYLTPGFPSGPWYSLIGYHRTKVEWSPWAREDIALTPLGQDVAEGKTWSAHWQSAPSVTQNPPVGDPWVIPAWGGSFCRVLDIWSSEEIEESMLENLAWNLDLPGAEATYPSDNFAAQYMPKNNPGLINHKLRFDQVISARYREFVSTSNAPGESNQPLPSAMYWGGQMMNVHDHTIGGNASMAESIHHARYVYWVSSNNYQDNVNFTGSANDPNRYNYLKLGFFIPSAIDTLTVGLAKVESDAEWATLARRGASR